MPTPSQHSGLDIATLKQELGDFRDSLRMLQSTHPVGLLQNPDRRSELATPPPRKRVLDPDDSTNKAPAKLPKVQLPSKSAAPAKTETVMINRDMRKQILLDIFEVSNIRFYNELSIEQWCNKHVQKLPEEDVLAVAEAWGLPTDDAETALHEILRLWLLQQGQQ
jgi:hypothetical protein